LEKKENVIKKKTKNFFGGKATINLLRKKTRAEKNANCGIKTCATGYSLCDISI
jgi:hypothetical protein